MTKVAKGGEFYFAHSLQGNIYDVSVINFFDILGDVGGLYELLTIAAGILFKILFAFQMKRDLKRKTNKEESGDWFSYPALLNQNKSCNKKKRGRKVLN